jgi:tRNA-Thr(GGU) m(6)t(6)A37 methyltransferase TsaA
MVRTAGGAPATREFSIEGMTCQGCVDILTSALTQIPGVESATVSLEHKRAALVAKESKVPTDRILDVIRQAGYKGQLAPPEPTKDAATGGSIIMCPIGLVHSPYKEIKDTPIQGVFDKESDAWVELHPEYATGLKDLDGFSHAILLYRFHLSNRVDLVGRPYLEEQEHGIFAIRSPHRPNHIGFSVVAIRKVEGNRLYFRELDILDGTPVLDIKPYVRQFDSRSDAVSGWIEPHFKDGKQPDHTTAK